MNTNNRPCRIDLTCIDETSSTSEMSLDESKVSNDEFTSFNVDCMMYLKYLER